MIVKGIIKYNNSVNPANKSQVYPKCSKRGEQFAQEQDIAQKIDKYIKIFKE